MATKTVRRIVTAGVAGSAAIVLAAAPAGASSPMSSEGSGSTSAAAPGVDHGTAVGSARFTFTVLQATCVGRTSEVLRVRQRENGLSGAAQFRQIYQGQFLTTGGWRVAATKAITSPFFGNDSRSFIFTPPAQRYTYGPTKPASHRIVWQGQWLNSGGGIIASATRAFDCA